MRRFYSTFISLAFMLLFAGCRDIPEYQPSRQGVFDALWQMIDRNYCFLDEKGLDWDSVRTVYAPRAESCKSQQQLFSVCADMLCELRDGHVNLSAPFATSYYRKWWSDYPQNYDARLVEQYYFNFNYRSLGSVNYGILSQNVGYVRLPSFESGLGEGNIDYIFGYLAMCDALIIDVRDNGGGALSNVETWVSRFINERTLAGYISHKTGPGHHDFSKPYAYYYEPASSHIIWMKQVVVLANRSTFSAANNFVSVMKLLPQVNVVGATTGGGSGMPFSSELPNGWGVRFSACPITDALGRPTEFGVEPSEGCAVDLDPVAALSGHDTILDFAIDFLVNGSLK